MPTLNRYAASNSKTGYYIRANVGGSHPVTLQTTLVAEEIFKENGYRDQSTVPTKLVWAMFDIGLLYTESSISAPIPAPALESSFSGLLGASKLSEKTRQQLISYLSSYSGPEKAAAQKLLAQLRETTQGSQTGSSRSTSRSNSQPSARSNTSSPSSSNRKSANPKSTSTPPGGATRSNGAKGYTPSTPWRKGCPFCQKSVHHSEEAYIHHWASASTCGFSVDSPKQVDIVDGDWDTIVEKVKREREKQEATAGIPLSECPYCSTEIPHRSAEAYVEHWKDGSCKKQLESLPDDRPTVVPFDVWWDIKDLWTKRNPPSREASTSTSTPEPRPKSRSQPTNSSGVIRNAVSSVRDFLS